jgi:hypothetical protein
MPVLLLILLALDGVSGRAGVRARKYRYAPGLGALLVPLSLGLSTLAFRAVDGQADVDVQENATSVAMGPGGLLVAVVWMTVVAITSRTRQGQQ